MHTWKLFYERIAESTTIKITAQRNNNNRYGQFKNDFCAWMIKKNINSESERAFESLKFRIIITVENRLFGK